MEGFNYQKENLLKIETLENKEGGAVSFCPERGGIITSIKIKGKEILSFDEATFKDLNESVRGGIPMLFPNAGPLESPLYPDLKRHGFARNSNEWQIEKGENILKETLVASGEMKKAYPFDFRFSNVGSFEENGSFTLTQEFENKEENKEMPISAGLHPYFKVSNEDKKDIEFDFDGGEIIKEKFEDWAIKGKSISIDNPKIKNKDAVLRIIIPGLGTLVIDPGIEYEKIWVWTVPGQDYICIEPVMHDKNGLVENPTIIKPKGTLKTRVNFNLE